MVGTAHWCHDLEEMQKQKNGTPSLSPQRTTSEEELEVESYVNGQFQTPQMYRVLKNPLLKPLFSIGSLQDKTMHSKPKK